MSTLSDKIGHTQHTVVRRDQLVLAVIRLPPLNRLLPLLGARG